MTTKVDTKKMLLTRKSCLTHSIKALEHDNLYIRLTIESRGGFASNMLRESIKENDVRIAQFKAELRNVRKEIRNTIKPKTYPASDYATNIFKDVFG